MSTDHTGVSSVQVASLQPARNARQNKSRQATFERVNRRVSAAGLVRSLEERATDSGSADSRWEDKPMEPLVSLGFYRL